MSERIANHSILLVLVANIAIGVSGCANMTGWNNPFAGEVPAYKSQYGPTPAEQAQRLRETAAIASSISLEEQERVSSQLYETYSRSSDPIIRREAVRALGSFAVPSAAAGLQAAGNDDESSVRIAACEAWGIRRDPEAVAALAGLLKNDTNVDVRLAASAALSNCPPEAAAEQLATVLDDRDPAVQLAVIEGLRTTTGVDVGNDPKEWTSYIRTLQPANAINPVADEVMIAQPPNGGPIVR